MAGAGRLSGATAIVTGASAGIAEASAKILAREGAAVAIVSRNVADARLVGGEIEAEGGSVLVLEADVTRARDVRFPLRARGRGSDDSEREGPHHRPRFPERHGPESGNGFQPAVRLRQGGIDRAPRFSPISGAVMQLEKEQ